MTLLIAAVAGLTGLVVLAVVFAVLRVAHSPHAGDDFSARLSDVTTSEIASELKDQVNSAEKNWTNFWYNLYQNTGRITTSKSMPGRLAIFLALAAFGIGFLVWPRDIFAGIVMSGLSLVALRGFFMLESSRRKKALEKQLPNMLSGMRANLQANLTPQQALLAIAEDVPAPLGDELKLLKADLGVNVPLETALRNFADRVPSREIKFLVASIEIAVTSGADLDPQLQTIQQIVAQRARIGQKLASAVANAQPAILISAIMIPAGFLFSYYSSSDNRTFWHSLLGLVAGGIVAVMYGAGLFISKKLVDGVAKT